MPAPSLVLGTMTFGDTVDEAGSAAMLEAAVAAGVASVDTANGYAGGETERILGRLLPQLGVDLPLATKAGMPHPDAEGHAPLSREGLRRSLAGSLRRLGRDSVELFYLHQPDAATPVAETVDAIAELQAEGRIGALGVSNLAAWQIADVERECARAGIAGPVVAQQLYNLVARRIDAEYRAFALGRGIETMAYNPLGGGLLTGRHRFEEAPEDGRFGDSRLAGMYRERYWNAQLFEAIAALGAIAEAAGLTLAELSFRWLASQEVVGSILLGGSKPAQLAANAAAIARGPLDEATLAACDEIGRSLAGPMPAYNR